MSKLFKAVLLSLWLPALLLVVAVVRFGPGFVTEPAEGYAAMGMGLAWAWLAAIPLTLALLLLRPVSDTGFWICALALAPLSVVAFVLGGLFGEAGPASSVVSLAIPAWIVYAVLRLRKSGGGGGRSKAKPKPKTATAAKPRPSRA